jgi:DNA polymerase-3 subunit chi
MTEVLFYQLGRGSLEDVLPGLLERTRARAQRALVRVGTAERLASLDTTLWTYSENSFLAHGTAEDGEAARQPIYLTTENENPSGAGVLFLVDGAWPEDWARPDLAAYARIVALFDSGAEGLEGARAAWRGAKAAGYDVTYWKQAENGKWEKLA